MVPSSTPRFLTSLSSLVAWAALGTLAVAACGGDDVAAAPPSDDAGVGSDGAPVDPPDGAAACAPGTADCNGNPADGCETAVTTRTACAACGVACNASQWCAPEGCRSPTAKPFARVPAGVLGATSDAAGNQYLVGSFSGTVNFGIGGDRTASGLSDAFVIKIGASGAPAWLRTFGGNDSDFAADVAVDADSNVYVTGVVRGTGVDLGNGTAVATAGSDVFVLSLNSEGGFRWGGVYASEGTSFDQGKALALGASRIYVAGVSGRNFSIAGGAAVGTTANRGYGFLAALDRATGNHVWSKAFAEYRTDIGDSYLDIYGMALTSDEAPVVAGEFRDQVNFGAGVRSSGEITVGMTTFATEAGFVVSYTAANGAFRWERFIASDNRTVVNGVATDASGNVYATGSFVEDTDFGAGLIGHQPDNLDHHFFLASYDPLGMLRWAKTGTNPMGGRSEGAGVTVHEGKVFFSGNVAGRVTVAGETIEAGANADQQVMIGSLDAATGAYRWVRHYGSSASDYGTIAVMTQGRPQVAARIGGAASVDGTVVEPLGSVTTAILDVTE